MKRIFLLALCAVVLAVNLKAQQVIIHSSLPAEKPALAAVICGCRAADAIVIVYGDVDPEHIPSVENLVRYFQNQAISGGAQNAEEIDQFVKLAWRALYTHLSR